MRRLAGGFERFTKGTQTGAGALILGVWGIRAILVGTGVPGITAVDLCLILVILFLLVAMTVRTLRYLYRLADI